MRSIRHTFNFVLLRRHLHLKPQPQIDVINRSIRDFHIRSLALSNSIQSPIRPIRLLSVHHHIITHTHTHRERERERRTAIPSHRILIDPIVYMRMSSSHSRVPRPNWVDSVLQVQRPFRSVTPSSSADTAQESDSDYRPSLTAAVWKRRVQTQHTHTS